MEREGKKVALRGNDGGEGKMEYQFQYKYPLEQGRQLAIYDHIETTTQTR